MLLKKNRILIAMGVLSLAPATWGNGAPPPPTEKRDAMLEDMRASVDSIASEFGDIPFGFFFTNDPAMRQTIGDNYAILEEASEVGSVLNEKSEDLARVRRALAESNVQLQANRKLVSEAKERLRSLREKTEKAEQVEQSLQEKEKRVAELQSLVESMQSHAQRADEVSRNLGNVLSKLRKAEESLEQTTKVRDTVVADLHSLRAELGIVQKTAKLDEMLTLKQDALASLEESIAAKQGKMDSIAQQLSEMEKQSQSRFANVDNVVEERRQELLRIEESIEQAERELEQKRSAIAKAGKGNVTSPVLPSRRSSGKTTDERQRSKEMMVQEMREAIGEIAGAYGDIPFGFLFTNDPAMSRLIQSNFAVLEETVEVSGLLDSKRRELSRTQQQVGDVQAELDAKRKQLSNLEESVSKTQVALRQRQSELARLEAGIAPVRDAVEQLTEYFNAPKEASIRVLNTGSMSLSANRRSGDSAEDAGASSDAQGKAALIPKATGKEPRQRIYGGGN